METVRTQNQWAMNNHNNHDVASSVLLDDGDGEIAVDRRCCGSKVQQSNSGTKSDVDLGMGERAISAAGAAFLSAIIVNPLDVIKVIFLCLFGFRN